MLHDIHTEFCNIFKQAMNAYAVNFRGHYLHFVLHCVV
jgi:hypothetical protein